MLPTPPPKSSVVARVPWWAIILLALTAVLVVLGLGSPRYRSIFIAVGQGLLVTIRVSVIAYAASLVFGTLIALALVSRRLWLREATKAYVEVMRGVPMLVLLYYIAFAVGPAIIAAYAGAFAPVIEAGFLPAITVRDFSFEWRAVTALTFGYSAFIAEIVRGGIEAVAKGQTE